MRAVWCFVVIAGCAFQGHGILPDGGSPDDAETPSCNGLAATCGPGANDNCCATATPIPGGTFFRSHDVAADGIYPSMSYPATISAFRLDKYEVTVGRFRKFVAEGKGTQTSPPAAGAGARTLNGVAAQGGWDANWNGSLSADTVELKTNVKCNTTYQAWTDAVGASESLPINCITWYEAMAFCIWDGGYLPTEAEWNYAASGGSEQRAYPWSSPPAFIGIDCSYANFYDNAYCVNPPTGGVGNVGSESPNGDGKWGQTDLGGNVYEWVLDWYTLSYTSQCINCADLAPSSSRVIRGGGFFGDATILRAANRSGGNITGRGRNIGVRCMRKS